jgi:histidinol-phosphate phosphatase family protein
VLAAAAADDNLHAFVSSHYFKDTGTPDRLDATRADVARGTVARRGMRGPRPALFLDRDGVINPTSPEFYGPDGYVLNAGVAEALATANRAGIPVLVVTNQPAIAKGLMSEEDHTAVRARMDALLAEAGAFVDDYARCPHHPESGHVGEVTALKITCDCRKPSPGMIHALARHHTIDLTRSVMVGDSWRDREAAAAAGVAFVSAAPEDAPSPSDAIRRALAVLGC